MARRWILTTGQRRYIYPVFSGIKGRCGPMVVLAMTPYESL
jgi:hypothetical protein